MNLKLSAPRVLPGSAVRGVPERENVPNQQHQSWQVTVIVGPVSHGGRIYNAGETLTMQLPGALNLIACGYVVKAP